MKRIVLIISFLILLFEVDGACPVGTISSVDNGFGSYTFTLNLDYSGSQATTINGITWEFDDGTSLSVPPSQLSVTHQFPFAASTTYAVTAAFNTSAIGNQSSCNVTTAPLSISVPTITAPYSCPTPYFNHFHDRFTCATGTHRFNWDYCDPDDYWVADYVVWFMGDGTTLTTTGMNYVEHIYALNSPIVVSATAFFTGINGETCNAPLLFSPQYTVNISFCSLLDNNANEFYTTYNFSPQFAQPDLYVLGGDFCQSDVVTIKDAGGTYPTGNGAGAWNYQLFIDGTSIASNTGLPGSSWMFQATLPAGDHLVEIQYTNSNDPNWNCVASDALTITVDSCEQEPCTECINFKPENNERYWVSGWVKQSVPEQVKTYNNVAIELEFSGGTTSTVSFAPSGDIIEGWQRISGAFTVPNATTGFKLHLVNNGGTNAFFDDVRVHPFNASMKSYVYDPETLWLTAELDDNNYATFYEYDKEGQLIRIKKETARGIMTIQESRSSNPKSSN